jgi:putative ABC transport system ATP-binding protein
MKDQRTEVPLVQMQAVYKYHRTKLVETAAINGIDLSIQQGEFLAIMGPSGSGKSTLLNLIGMIDEISRGDYYFMGVNTRLLSARKKDQLRKGNISFIFQSFNLIDELTAAENIALPLRYLKIPLSERANRVEEALKSLDMWHRRNHYPAQLSGGQQQRVAIARAIVIEPKIILADEPTGNLDSENGKTVMEKLQFFHSKGSTIIMVTHSEADASWAQRKIKLFDGQAIVSEKVFLEK